MSEELHPLEAITSIYFVRHGHTRATELGLLYSDPLLEITDKGEAQAKAAAAYLEKIKPDVLVRGKATRVAQSAAPIEEKLGMTASLVDGFEEWHVGNWEGRTYLDIKKNDPEQYHIWCANPIANAPPSGESIADFTKRIAHSLSKFTRAPQFEGKTICMVTHSGIIRSALIEALEMPVANFWRFSIPTGSITKIDFSKNFATVHFVSLKPD